ncbi:hypothetical protein PG994_009640 [Apiospora phragmitis]|uniref:Uncharacterized protein n=1 Tax=Apiospora phragmitis TaxID=2905665 RepID=A0ABR1U9E2_9PEZI
MVSSIFPHPRGARLSVPPNPIVRVRAANKLFSATVLPVFGACEADRELPASKQMRWWVYKSMRSWSPESRAHAQAAAAEFITLQVYVFLASAGPPESSAPTVDGLGRWGRSCLLESGAVSVDFAVLTSSGKCRRELYESLLNVRTLKQHQERTLGAGKMPSGCCT